eukprot:7839055-Pyramimonas_sp.AAC.1
MEFEGTGGPGGLLRRVLRVQRVRGGARAPSPQRDLGSPGREAEEGCGGGGGGGGRGGTRACRMDPK